MISVVIASYNYEQYIAQTIESVINQTVSNWELIVIDDGSKDNSVKIIEEYCRKDSRIKLYTHQDNKNLGLAETLKLAVSKTSGDYIAFLESDDYWNCKNLEHKYNSIKEYPFVDLFFNAIDFIGEKQDVDSYLENTNSYFLKQKYCLKNDCLDLKFFLTNNFLPTFSCIMVKKDAILKSNFITPSKPNLDWFLWVQLLKSNPNLAYIDQKDTCWRIHKGSYISKRNKKEINNFFSIIHDFILKDLLPKKLFLISKFLHLPNIQKIDRKFVQKFEEKLIAKYPQTINIYSKKTDVEKPFSDKKLLSVCIPTFNRADALEQSIQSVVSQDFFVNTNCVELIISDNCSSDNTKEVVSKYTSLFPDKIRYYRNEENIKDKNFEKALSYGTAEYLKLSNDTISYNENSLKEMCTDILEFIEEKPILYFSSGFIPNRYRYDFTTGIAGFLSKESYGMTAIGSFGIWREDFQKINWFNDKSNLNLVQVDVILREIIKKKDIVFSTPFYFFNIVYPKKGGYNVAKVFGYNYLSILSEYLQSGHISEKAFKAERKKVLENLIIPLYFDFDNKFSYDTNGYFKYLSFYYKDWFFYLSFIKITRKYLKSLLSKLINRFF